MDVKHAPCVYNEGGPVDSMVMLLQLSGSSRIRHFLFGDWLDQQHTRRMSVICTRRQGAPWPLTSDHPAAHNDSS
jgi:hypothetical protein